MGPRYIYKDMLDNVVRPIACVSMKHQNQLEQMANWGHVRYNASLGTSTLVHFHLIPSSSPWSLFGPCTGRLLLGFGLHINESSLCPWILVLK
jgi:hypothetical protein